MANTDVKKLAKIWSMHRYQW